MPQSLDVYSDLAVIDAELATRKMLPFVKQVWKSKSKQEFYVGRHTVGICEEIDKAIENFRNGISTYIILTVPPQHGKSEIVSRALPPFFLGQFPDHETMVVSYAASLAETFSKDGRKIMRSGEYATLFPENRIARDNAGVQEWGLAGRNGKARFYGISGGVTGKGAAMAVVDDPISGREAAESEVMREKTWDAFRNDVMTRLAPVHIVLVTCTRWHTDDVVGRIIKEMAKNENYPKFKILEWPASAPGEYEWLFTERYSPAFYRNQMALQGPYGWSSLYMCNPIPRTGNIIRADKIQILKAAEFDSITKNMRFARGWDLASGQKQVGENPDFTSGCKAAKAWRKMSVEGFRVPVLFVADYVRGKWNALERNSIIVSTAIGDGNITVGVEAFGAYKDAYTTVRQILSGTRSVIPVRLPGDKVAKAETISPMFEAGNVYFREGPWNQAVIAQMTTFPGGANDDDVDAATVVNNVLDKRTDWT